MSVQNIKEINFTPYAKTFITLIDEYTESYGCNIFVDIVSGSKRKKLPEKLVNSKYYGMHSDVSRTDLKACMSYLLESNLVSKKNGIYSELKLTANGKKWLSHENPQLCLIISLSTELCEKIEISNQPKTKSKSKNKTPSYIETYELFQNQNKSIDEIANIRDLTNTTVENHLVICLKSGLSLDLNHLGVTIEKKNLILGVISDLNTNKLTKIKEECEKLKVLNINSNNKYLDITYFDIKCVIALMK